MATVERKTPTAKKVTGEKMKVRGKPFEKGDDSRRSTPNRGAFVKGDPRCNRDGSRSKAFNTFSATMRQLFVEEGLEEVKLLDENGVPTGQTITKARAVVKRLYLSAGQGERWAIQELLDRTIGRAKETVHVMNEDLGQPAEERKDKLKNLSTEELRALAKVAEKLEAPVENYVATPGPVVH